MSSIEITETSESFYVVLSCSVLFDSYLFSSQPLNSAVGGSKKFHIVGFHKLI